jgi:S1-C subfamily serine protease
MAPNPTNSLRYLRLILWSVVALVLVLLARPWIERWLITLEAEPRAITARGALADDERTTIAIFEAVSPSVVYITTLKRVVDFWTRNVTEVPRGTGSGFVWDEHGHVVTNYHVISGAQAAQVRLADQRAYNAVLVGASPEHDLAVLRINVPFNLPPPVQLGSSRDLRVGQKVLAIGNPFGLDYTLTTGVISALDRSIQSEEAGAIEHLIQTDAAINPGNSGGPLIDSAGRLIGINTAIFSPSGAYAGIGFAVPVDTVNRVVPRLVAYGRYIRPSLGIAADDDISEKVTASLGVEGVLVLEVQEGSPAEKAGLRGTRVVLDGSVVPGDIIMRLDGEPVRKVGELIDALDERSIGDQVELTINREGQTRSLVVSLERWRR